jgi:hypothetical protein
MATEDVKPNPEPDTLFTRLAEPFDPSEIKWRVTHTNRDGNRGAVILGGHLKTGYMWSLQNRP